MANNSYNCCGDCHCTCTGSCRVLENAKEEVSWINLPFTMIISAVHRSGLLTYLQDDPNATIETIGIVENPVYDGAEFDETPVFSYQHEDKEVQEVITSSYISWVHVHNNMVNTCRRLHYNILCGSSLML